MPEIRYFEPEKRDIQSEDQGVFYIDYPDDFQPNGGSYHRFSFVADPITSTSGEVNPVAEDVYNSICTKLCTSLTDPSFLNCWGVGLGSVKVECRTDEMGVFVRLRAFLKESVERIGIEMALHDYSLISRADYTDYIARTMMGKLVTILSTPILDIFEWSDPYEESQRVAILRRMQRCVPNAAKSSTELNSAIQTRGISKGARTESLALPVLVWQPRSVEQSTPYTPLPNKNLSSPHSK